MLYFSPAMGHLARANRFEKFAQGVVILIGLRSAMVARNLPVASDGLAYLDLARACLRHDWSIVVNGYWGPLYAWLLAAMLYVVHPTARQEFAAARGLNFLIFLLCFYAFRRFWRSVAAWNRKPGAIGLSLPDAYPLGWELLGYVLFVTQVAWFMDLVGPDLLVGTLVLLITARLFELDHGERRGIADYAGLGVLLAIGFYTKAILFYFALFVLAALAIRALCSRHYRGAITAAVVCALLVSPYVAALSYTLGHFTVGETGRLNYAWFVDGTETGAWTEGAASFPFFPGPVALNTPRVFLIPHLAGVTYAPWYDAARFDQHSRATVNLRGQMRQLSTNFRSLAKNVLGTQSALLVCAIILICGAPRVFLRRLADAWFCIAPALMIIGMYLLVHLVSRFMIGFSLGLWGIVFSSILIAPDEQLLARRALLSGVAVFAAFALPGLASYLGSPTQTLIARDVVVAEAMPSYGVRPGDWVGLIGNGQEAYWAHWARASVVAEISSMDAPSFWSASTEQQQEAVHAMEESGAKAIVWLRDSDRACPQPWAPLPERSGCIISRVP